MSGDDVIHAFTGDAVTAGTGSDTVLLTRSSEALAGAVDGSHVALGSEADHLVLNPDLQATSNGNGAPGTTIDDFTLAEGDQLGIILPAADLGALGINVVQDPAGGFTDVILTLPGTGAVPVTQTCRLSGVTNFSAADIQLFEDEAAAQAGTAYAQA